jgi:hypothetical protein
LRQRKDDHATNSANQIPGLTNWQINHYQSFADSDSTASRTSPWQTNVARHQENDLKQLRIDAAGLLLRLAAFPAGGLQDGGPAVDAIEQLDTEVLKQSSAVRAGRDRAIGETRGIWRVVQPVQQT